MFCFEPARGVAEAFYLLKWWLQNFRLILLCMIPLRVPAKSTQHSQTRPVVWTETSSSVGQQNRKLSLYSIDGFSRKIISDLADCCSTREMAIVYF